MMLIASVCALFCAFCLVVIFILAMTFRNRGTIRERRLSLILRFSISFPLLLSAANYFILQLGLSTWLLSNSCGGPICVLSVDSLYGYAVLTTLVPYAVGILSCSMLFLVYFAVSRIHAEFALRALPSSLDH